MNRLDRQVTRDDLATPVRRGCPGLTESPVARERLATEETTVVLVSEVNSDSNKNRQRKVA